MKTPGYYKVSGILKGEDELNAVIELRKDSDKRSFDRSKLRLKEWTQTLKDSIPGSPEHEKAKEAIIFYKKNIDEYSKKVKEYQTSSKETKTHKVVDISPFNTSDYYLFKGNKLLFQAPSMKTLKDMIKSDMTAPSKNVKVYIISFKTSTKSEHVLSIGCTQYTITPKLALVVKDGDDFQTFTYSKDEIDNIGFEKSHIGKIIKAVKDETISFEKPTVPISDVLHSSKKKHYSIFKEGKPTFLLETETKGTRHGDKIDIDTETVIRKGLPSNIRHGVIENVNHELKKYI